MILKLAKRGAPFAVLACFVLLGGCALSLQTLPKITASPGPSYPVRAEFANVLNLPDDAQVRIGAQVVGIVGTISTSNFEADLTLNIKKSVHLLVGTTAQIRFDNPLGDEYVMLQEPPVVTSAASSVSGQYIAPNALIPESATSTAPSVEDTFGALSLVLNGGGINQLQVIIHELNNTFNGNQPQIRSFLMTIDKGFASLDSGKTSIDNALSSIGNLTNKLNGGRQTISNGIATIAPAIGVLASENTQISSLIDQLSNLGTVGSQVAQESGQNSVNDVKALLPVVQQLQSVAQQIGPDLNDLAQFESESLKVAPGDYLQANVIANVLFPAGSYEPTPMASLGPHAPQSQTGGQDSGASGAQAVTGILGTGVV